MNLFMMAFKDLYTCNPNRKLDFLSKKYNKQAFSREEGWWIGKREKQAIIKNHIIVIHLEQKCNGLMGWACKSFVDRRWEEIKINISSKDADKYYTLYTIIKEILAAFTTYNFFIKFFLKRVN